MPVLVIVFGFDWQAAFAGPVAGWPLLGHSRDAPWNGCDRGRCLTRVTDRTKCSNSSRNCQLLRCDPYAFGCGMPGMRTWRFSIWTRIAPARRPSRCWGNASAAPSSPTPKPWSGPPCVRARGRSLIIKSKRGYRAANWLAVGRTTGRTRQDRHTCIQAPVKDVYLYPLRRDFREALQA